jgi:histone deacetylase 11
MHCRPPIIYSRRYNLGVPGIERLHAFNARKYAHAMRLLRRSGTLHRRDVLKPLWPADALLQRVHWRRYLQSVRKSATIAKIVELPPLARLPSAFLRFAILNPMRWAVGGTVVAAHQALAKGCAINLGGGFHHAHADFGHGFCVYSDVAIAIGALRAQGTVCKFLIIDLDAHQGDGHADLFRDDKSVQILDMYNANVFPRDDRARDRIDWEIRLRSGTSDKEYLERLEATLPDAVDASRPDLAFYLAGTDIVSGDPLGLLNVSPRGVLQRDLFVWEQLTSRRIPLVMLTAGGYTSASSQLIATTIEQILKGTAADCSD